MGNTSGKEVPRSVHYTHKRGHRHAGKHSGHAGKHSGHAGKHMHSGHKHRHAGKHGFKTRRRHRYRGGTPSPSPLGKSVVSANKGAEAKSTGTSSTGTSLTGTSSTGTSSTGTSLTGTSSTGTSSTGTSSTGTRKVRNMYRDKKVPNLRVHTLKLKAEKEAKKEAETKREQHEARERSRRSKLPSRPRTENVYDPIEAAKLKAEKAKEKRDAEARKQARILEREALKEASKGKAVFSSRSGASSSRLPKYEPILEEE